MAHAWTADRLGDPTARLLGRVSLNPMVHADPIGTVLFPLIAMVSGAPLIGWAKPVPVNVAPAAASAARLRAGGGGRTGEQPAAWRCGAAIVLALLPVSPMTLGEPNVSAPLAALLSQAMRLNVLLAVFNMIPIPPLDGGNVLGGLLPPSLARHRSIDSRPYGFLLLYALMLTGGFDYLVVPAVPLHPVVAAMTPVELPNGARRVGHAADRPAAPRPSRRRARQLGAAAGRSTTASISSPTGTR